MLLLEIDLFTGILYNIEGIKVKMTNILGDTAEIYLSSLWAEGFLVFT
jgi:hypothetical protein